MKLGGSGSALGSLGNIFGGNGGVGVNSNTSAIATYQGQTIPGITVAQPAIVTGPWQQPAVSMPILPQPTGHVMDFQFTNGDGSVSYIKIDVAYVEVMNILCHQHAMHVATFKRKPVMVEVEFDLDELDQAMELMEVLDGGKQKTA